MIKRPSKVNDDLKVTYRTFVRNPFGLKGQPASQPTFLMAGADDARSDATADAAAAWLPRSAPRRGTFAENIRAPIDAETSPSPRGTRSRTATRRSSGRSTASP